LVKNFLKGNLDLNFPEEKFYTKYLKKSKANFLGFQICQSSKKILSKEFDVNSYAKINQVKMNAKSRKAFMQIPRTQITFNVNEVLCKLVEKGFVCFKAGKFFPTSYKPVLQYDIASIVLYIKTIFCSLANYYRLAYNWYEVKTLFNYFGRYCAAMTIAHKTKSKITKVFKKYSSKLIITNGSNKVIVSFGVLSNANFKKKVWQFYFPFYNVTNIEQLLSANL